MRNLVYVPNKQVGVAKVLKFESPSYRTPKFFEGPEGQVKSVVVLDICPNWREIHDAYLEAGVPVEVVEVAAALYTARQAPGLKAAAPAAAPPPKAAPRTRKELFAAAKALGVKAGARLGTEKLRARVQAAEDKE